MEAAELENAKKVARSRRAILAHQTDAGNLKDFASVVARYIYHLSPGCYFERRTGSKYEWDLKPDNWISLYLSKGRYGASGKVIISLNISPRELAEATKLEVKRGRFPQWSRITVKSAADFKDSLDAICYVSRTNTIA